MKPDLRFLKESQLKWSRLGHLVVIIFLAGCVANHNSTQVISTEATLEHAETVTSTIQPTMTLPSKTPTETIPPSPMPSFTLTPTSPTWTPLPTLTLHGALLRVAELEETNGGCRFPCWWGITPGVTSFQKAKQFLSSFTKVEPDPGPVSRYIDGEQHFMEALDFEYPPFDYSVPRHTGLGIKDGQIWTIVLNPYTSAKQYTLSRLLTAYGEPDLALIFTGTSVPEPGNAPFDLVLFFRKYCFMAEFHLEGLIHADRYVRAYPQGERPEIRLWSQDYCDKVDAEKIHRLLKGTLPVLPFVPLDQATGLSNEEFTRLYADPSYAEPLESPFEVWENLSIISLTPTPGDW